jgi:hypothetical protein
MRALALLLVLPALAAAQGVQPGGAPAIAPAAPGISAGAGCQLLMPRLSGSHVCFAGGRLRDVNGQPWAMTGTVPQVARTSSTPPGAGPFADANRYDLAYGLSSAANYGACFVFKWDGTGSDPTLFNDGAYPTSGVQIGLVGTTKYFRLVNATTATIIGDTHAVSLSVVNVACAWRAGTSCYVKTNLGTTATLPCASHTAGPGPGQLGRNRGTGYPFTGTLYEAIFPTGLDEATVVAIQTQVKTKLGITAW